MRHGWRQGGSVYDQQVEGGRREGGSGDALEKRDLALPLHGKRMTHYLT